VKEHLVDELKKL
jgi:serine/threonine protein phosphatase PrpC